MESNDPAAVREVVCTIQDQIRYLKKAVEHTIELSKEKSLVIDSTAPESKFIIDKYSLIMYLDIKQYNLIFNVLYNICWYLVSTKKTVF